MVKVSGEKLEHYFGSESDTVEIQYRDGQNQQGMGKQTIEGLRLCRWDHEDIV